MASAHRRWIKPAVFFGLAVLVSIAGVETFHWWRHVDEPNAKVEADFTLLSSSVNATVEIVHVRPGDRVEKGALLASMDTAVAALDVATLVAEAAKKDAVRNQVKAELVHYKREMDDKIATSKASITLQRREHKAWQSRRTIAQSNVDRHKKLASSRTISKRQLDDVTDRLLDVTSELRSLETSIQTNLKRLQELESALHKEVVFHTRIEAINRAMDKINVQLRQSKRRLTDMDIRAPIAGVIDEVYVSVGVYIEDGQRAFLLHDPDALWLEAQVDESDIEQVVAGQSVTIEFDAYPFEYYEGVVRTIGNATLGSMTQGQNGGMGQVDPRLAQRIKVLIDLPQIDKATWPGMRASVNIAVR